MIQNVIIFGASGDLGSVITDYLLKKNYNLILTFNNKNFKNIKKKLLKKKKIKNVFFQKCNLENENSIKNVIKFSKKKIGAPDLIINTCGLFQYDVLENFNYKDATKMFKVNALSTLAINKEIYKLKLKKLIKVITIGSSSALNGFKDTYSYCGSKHALLGIIKSLNQSLHNKKILNFCINVGSLKNTMGKKIRSKDYENFIDQEEIIKAINYLIDVKLPGIAEEIYIKRFFHEKN
jgi:NADP-dependent 3-hydroxy acid dehydrogenase YdfG